MTSWREMLKADLKRAAQDAEKATELGKATETVVNEGFMPVGVPMSLNCRHGK